MSTTPTLRATAALAAYDAEQFTARRETTAAVVEALRELLAADEPQHTCHGDARGRTPGQRTDGCPRCTMLAERAAR